MPKMNPEIISGSWGIMGGAFDPIHNGHLRLAEQASKKLNLSGILFVVSYNPPHRQKSATLFENRLNMVDLAISEYDNFHSSDLEKNIEGPTYAVNMIDAIKAQYPNVDWYLILGEDNLAIFDSWYKPDEVISKVKVVIGNRPGYDNSKKSKWMDKIESISMPPADISSTEIRRRLRAAEALDDLVPSPVLEYVKNKGLYL